MRINDLADSDSRDPHISQRVPHVPENNLLLIDPRSFRDNLDRRPFKIGHRLEDHPLLQLPRLVRLAERLSPTRGVGSILYFKADHAVNQVDGGGYGSKTSPPGGKPQRTFVARNLERPALSAEETIAQIESCNAWMQLRDVGADPEYASLLRALLDELGGYTRGLTPGVRGARADIFVSSPGATTPFHLDEEHNFLLQVRGSKVLSIADGSDRSVLSEPQLVEFFRGDGELAPYAPHLEERSTHVALAPGEGVHIPPCFPHWVKNGGAVSVSLGILWHSDVTAARRQLYRVNAWLRRLGLRPRSPGETPALDALKLAPFRLRRAAARTLGAGWHRLSD
jgi:hypothetical protein